MILECCMQPHRVQRRQMSIASSVSSTQHQHRLLRSPSPNCQCSCHREYLLQQRHPFRSTAAPAPAAAAVASGGLHHPSSSNDQTHIYSFVSQKTPPPLKRLPFPTAVGLSSSTPATTTTATTSVPFHVRQRVPSSRESNYCDITELYESVTTAFQQRNGGSYSTTTSGHYYPIFGSSLQYSKPTNSLVLVRINPFKFPTMEPLHVDNRLIVFSLLDSFTKLSPNKIFENFIKKLKEEGRKSITVFNLGESIEFLRPALECEVCELGWPERHAPSLEKLCRLCKALDSWLQASVLNVAVIYSKRDLSRASLAIAAFLQYLNICLGEECTFDLESMQSYFQFNLEQYLQPSQKRYIGYFHGLLSGESQMTSQQFYLNAVTIRKVPNFDGHGLCQPFIKIYQGLNLIYCSPILSIDSAYAAANDAVVFALTTPLKVRGEILLKCYHRRSSPSARVAMFSLQFHTATLSENVAVFPKEQIDIAAYDKRFHDATQVELLFNEKSLQKVPEVRYLEDEQITKWNSYENFVTDVEYTKGPLDGSLYATVAKRSPTQQLPPQEEKQQQQQQPQQEKVQQAHQQVADTDSSPAVSDERKLDELLSELLLEIETFPDITRENPAKNKEVPSNGSSSNNNDLLRHNLATSSTSPPVELSSSSVINVSLVGSLMVQHTSVVDTSSDSVDAQAAQGAPSPQQQQLTWLQKQQLKLKSKQDQFQQKRNVVERQLIAELKSTIGGQKNDGGGDGDENDVGHNHRNGSVPVAPSSHDPPTPAVPVRTSSRNILMTPLYAEQAELGQPVRTLSLDHSPAQLPVLSNGSASANYQLLGSEQYSSVATSTPAGRQQLRQQETAANWKQNGAGKEDKHHQLQLSLQSEEIQPATTTTTSPQSPVHRPITPSFPVKEFRKPSMLHSPATPGGHVPLFIKDTSSFWYKPHISREETIKLLHDKPSGTFLIRDSHSFQGAYGLAVKVAAPADEEGSVPDSVRHFLIESTSKGVQIKGCAEEPVFSSLAALVYQHSLTRISLPITLVIPSADIETEDNGLQRLYENGAACHVLYFTCEDVESLTGDAAVRKVVDSLLQLKPRLIKPTAVHFKASIKGITLTDNSHKLFFRQHYPMQTVSHCSLDPENRSLIFHHEDSTVESVLYGFVARKKGSNTDNECLIFGQFESDQPSHAIVDFVNKLKSL